MKVRPISVNEFRWLKSASDGRDSLGSHTQDIDEYNSETAEMRAVLERMRAVNKEYRNLRLLFERGQI
jgi:cell shape-determining protein MreC